MSACQHTTLIPSNQCIGDSLRTINTNFTILNDGLCKIPKVVGNEKTTFTSPETDLLGHNRIKIDVAPTFNLFKKFDSITSNISLTSHSFSDGLLREVYEFPYISSSKDPKPFGSFDAISENGSPQLTLFWTASAPSNTDTVFALNSSVSFINKNQSSPDGPIHCFCEYDGKLHIGGAFNNIGTTVSQKFATINLQAGGLDNQLGNVGELGTSLFSNIPNHQTLFGENGFINFINQTNVFVTPEDQRVLFIVGGDYHSNSNGGRSLVIWDETTKVLYPFYVNGSIFNCTIVGSDLFVVGRFDFANFGLEPETLKSGKRNYTKSILKISLLKLITNQQHSAIDSLFCQNIRDNITRVGEINCVEYVDSQLFIGGDFVAEINGIATQQNFIALTLHGEIINSIKLIVNKPIHTMVYDRDLAILYIGGEFTNIIQHTDFFDELRQPPYKKQNEYTRAAAFDVQIEQAPVLLDVWKPRFNGTVRKFQLHGNSISSVLYAMGDFTQVNSNRASHIASLYKVTNPSPAYQTGELADWEIELPTAPTKQTNAILRSAKGLYLGGNFTKINGATRFYFAETTGVEDGLERIPFDVVWDFGGKVLSSNELYELNPLDLDTVRTKSSCRKNGTVITTTFPPLTETFKNQSAGQLCRFFIRRPCFSTKIGNLDITDDTYNHSVKILAWSLTFI